LNTLFLAWQAPEKRCWIPVGRLTFDGDNYRFLYLRGAEKAKEKCNFQPLESFPELNKVYESEILFPLFSNRVLAKSRPDYPDYIKWLNVPKDKDDPMALLARSGGRRATDNLEIFPCPELGEHGEYHVHFFTHGLRYLPKSSLQRIERLQPNDDLLLILDCQNPYDSNAILLRSIDCFLVGYCPRYLLEDVFTIIKECGDLPMVKAERVNLAPAPLQYRLLCNMTACWPDDFRPFETPQYQPIVKDFSSER